VKPFNQTPQQMLESVIHDGATVELCPIFMANAVGHTKADLLKGITVTTPAIIGDFMDQPEVRYFTF
jgi:hypothetical protein